MPSALQRIGRAGFDDERIGVSMDQSPSIVLFAENVRHA
jgi:hypothetical protein